MKMKMKMNDGFYVTIRVVIRVRAWFRISSQFLNKESMLIIDGSKLSIVGSKISRRIENVGMRENIFYFIFS